MANLMKAFLGLVSCLLISGCSAYKHLQPSDASCKFPYNALIKGGQYTASIDVFNKHISGIMLFKQMAPKTTRAVFTNEMGFKFFDFQFSPDSFHVYYILPAM